MRDGKYVTIDQKGYTILGVVAAIFSGIWKHHHDKASKENKENYTADAKSRAAEKQEA